jgi:hypothetical protein
MGICVLCNKNTRQKCIRCGGICAGTPDDLCAGRDGLCVLCLRRPSWPCKMPPSWQDVPQIEPVLKVQEADSRATVEIPADFVPTEPMLMSG